MHEYPHHYRVQAAAHGAEHVRITSDDLAMIESAPPREFDGPGDRWSPESLLVAAVADCFILTFRGVARASRFEWDDLTCNVVGVLDRVDRVTRFTRFDIAATLTVPAGTDADKATRLMEKAEQACLVTNSLTSEKHLTTEVVVAS